MILVIISYFSLRTVRKPRNKLFITVKCQAVKRKKTAPGERRGAVFEPGRLFSVAEQAEQSQEHVDEIEIQFQSADERGFVHGFHIAAA